MIWRLPHPVRGIVAFLMVVAAGSMVTGFGMGVPELLVVLLLASGAFALASTRTSRGATPSA